MNVNLSAMEEPPAEEPTDEARDAYERCTHAAACLRQRMRRGPLYDETWAELGCDDCGVWSE